MCPMSQWQVASDLQAATLRKVDGEEGKRGEKIVQKVSPSLRFWNEIDRKLREVEYLSLLNITHAIKWFQSNHDKRI